MSVAKFKAEGTAIFQLPEGGRMGFRVAVCDNGDGNEENNVSNAVEIVRCLNQDNEIKTERRKAKRIIRALLRQIPLQQIQEKALNDILAAEDFIKELK